MRVRILLIAALGFAAVTGSVIGGDTDTSMEYNTADLNQTPTVNKTSSVEDLDSSLEDLISADDRTAFAASHGLDTQNQTVRVIIEIDSDSSLPSEYDIRRISSFTSDRRTLIDAYVRIDDLAPLAETTAVERVRPPERANPTGNRTATTTAPVDTPDGGTTTTTTATTTVSQTTSGEDGPGFGILTVVIAVIATTILPVVIKMSNQGSKS